MNSVQKSLVAFDTDHIASYVFSTDRLKEIRGASSLLDRFNRYEMKRIACEEYGVDEEKGEVIYVNGGSGLFLVDENRAEEFGKHIQRMYREGSGGSATITFACQNLPNNEKVPVSKLKECDLKHELDLLAYQLDENKGIPLPTFALSSHPFMRLCSSCGVEYAEMPGRDERNQEAFYCAVCAEKQKEDEKVKKSILNKISFLRKSNERGKEEYLWDRILWYLKQEGYDLSKPGINRPEDFNVFRQFAEAKEYIGLIYADANNMGKMVERLGTLKDREDFAKGVDKAIHKAMAYAITQLLPGVNIGRQDDQGETETQNETEEEGAKWVFPFDILLVGGDDVVMVTDAAKAMNVALLIAQRFRDLANDKEIFADNEQIAKLLQEYSMSLSVGVVLAPVKYPFGLLQEMAKSALKFAKKAAADEQAESSDKKAFDGTRINFQVVTGGSHPNFNETYKKIYQKIDKERKLEFHASLRAYKPEDLERLLETIRKGHQLHLGRTKLHQLREAILEKNLTTSVQKGLATLRNWQEQQREHVVVQVYGFGQRHQKQRSDSNGPIFDFPRVTFPWFADGEHKGRSVYRTSLLDFIELYDFVTREGGNNGNGV